ncbi:MAG: glycosyltransferase [Planctomycetota bacterium]|nr:glycosyltransferase [Planctomycetota bacterium]
MGDNSEQTESSRSTDIRCDVLFIISSIQGGGAERKTTLLAGGLAKRGISVAILTTSPKTDQDFELHPDVRRIQMPGALTNRRGPLARIRALLGRIRFTRREVRKLRPRHIISLGDSEGLLALFCRTPESRQCIWTMSSRSLTAAGNPRNRLLLWLARSRDVLIITQTKAIEHEYRIDGFTRLAMIPNPISIPELRERPPRTEGPLKIVSVGRLIPEKSFETLIDSLAELEKSESGWRCAIIGEGPEDKTLRDRCEAVGLTEKIEFMGWREDVRELMRTSDLFVITSFVEGQPNALLEAMSESLPSVSTHFTGGAARDLLGSTGAGILAPVGDAQAVSDAIRLLMLEPEKRLKLGALGREAVSRFSVDEVTDQWMDHLGLGRPAHGGNSRHA